MTDPYAAIAERIVPGATLRRRWRLEGGVSTQVEALELALPNGDTQRFVIRHNVSVNAKPRDVDFIDREYGVLHALAERGMAVPEPLLLDTTGALLPASWMVMAFVEGTPIVAPDRIPAAMRRMAGWLADLHAIAPAALALPDLPRREDPLPDIRRHLPDGTLGDRIRAALGHRAPEAANPPALLHGDFWPGNVLWRDGEIGAVIDWEDTAVGDPLADLAGARMELLWEYDVATMEAFTGEYLARTRLDLENLPWWELMVASAGAAYMGNWRLDPETEASMRAKALWMMDDALRRIIMNR